VRRRHQSAGQSEIDGAGGIVSCPKYECAACVALKVAPSERSTVSIEISAILAGFERSVYPSSGAFNYPKTLSCWSEESSIK
jgi:hypothetical protein